MAVGGLWSSPALQVLHVEPACVMCGRGHGDDAGAGLVPPGPLQCVEQKDGQQEMPKVVEAKVQLKPIFCFSLRNKHDAR